MHKKIEMTGTVFLAGLAAGTVEVVWVMLFCLMSPLQATLIAEEIARSFVPHIAGSYAVTAGLIIHYALSVLISGVFAITLLRLLRNRSSWPTVLGMSGASLVVIWAINFFVILPVVNPGFVALLPYTVTLASKLGFGLCMGWVFVVRGASSAGHAHHHRLALLFRGK